MINRRREVRCSEATRYEAKGNYSGQQGEEDPQSERKERAKLEQRKYSWYNQVRL